MKIDWKRLIKIIFVTFFVGSLFSFFIIGNKDVYESLNKPFNLPSIVFPIVWSVLYLLMSISYYMVTEKEEGKEELFNIYAAQLILNSLWTFIFFGLKLYTLGFIWIIAILIAVILMIVKFYKANKVSGLINIPYIIWLLIAGYLNLMIAILN